jgi:hypothetical protein
MAALTARLNRFAVLDAVQCLSGLLLSMLWYSGLVKPSLAPSSSMNTDGSGMQIAGAILASVMRRRSISANCSGRASPQLWKLGGPLPPPFSNGEKSPDVSAKSRYTTTRSEVILLLRSIAPSK